MEFVSWDDYSQYMEKMFQTTNQLIEYCFQNLPFSIKIGGMNLHESQQFGTILGTVWWSNRQLEDIGSVKIQVNRRVSVGFWGFCADSWSAS